VNERSFLAGKVKVVLLTPVIMLSSWICRRGGLEFCEVWRIKSGEDFDAGILLTSKTVVSEYDRGLEKLGTRSAHGGLESSNVLLMMTPKFVDFRNGNLYDDFCTQMLDK
jgi:hypothetical protein